MRHESTAVADDRSDALLRRTLIALTTVTALIMGLWAWIQQNQSLLPPVDSDSGRTLLRQYQGLTYDIWLILLLLSVGYLINRTWVNQQREATQNYKASLGPVGSFLQFVRRNRITTILFISYTVAMIIGTTYTPKPGDLVANLDKSTDLIKPILQNLNTETVYRHNPTNKTGLILKITGIKP